MSNESKIPMNLVVFPSCPFEDALYETLQTSSGQVRKVPGQDWLRQGAPLLDGAMILAVTGDYSRERLLSSLREHGRTFALAVTGENPSWWDREILDHCVEFLTWPCRKGELALRLSRGCQGIPSSSGSVPQPQLLEEFARLNLIGQSPPFLKVLENIKKLARCDAPVLLRGESGTGKEMVARAIHYLGLRQDGPFIPVNCGALPDYLVENELFGHERGAYTDAKEAQTGLIGQAHSGTLFLDEVEALSPKAQVSLLRFLQSYVYQPLGARGQKEADVRIIAATNADLSAIVGQGQFRQDLWFRLQVMTLALPPLRERTEDVEHLAQHFLWQYSRKYREPAKTFHPATLAWMKTYHWPGNVRELDNVVHRLFVLSDGPLVTLPANALASAENESVNQAAGAWNPKKEVFYRAKEQSIAQLEKQYLKWLLTECQGNVTLAAKQSGKERRALGKLLKKYQIDKTLYRNAM